MALLYPTEPTTLTIGPTPTQEVTPTPTALTA